MSDMKLLTQKAYDGYLEKGYVETSVEEVIHNGSKGRYVHLTKELSTCGQIATAAGTILGGPILFVAIIGSAGVAAISCKSYVQYCVRPMMDGGYEVEGYVRDENLTKQLRDQDFQQLGAAAWSKQGGITLVKSGKYPWLQLKKYPQHSYISVYGPVSKISYLIVIPYKDPDKSILFAVANVEGNPCSASEIKKKAEKRCSRFGVRKVVMVDETLPLMTTDRADDNNNNMTFDDAFEEQIV